MRRRRAAAVVHRGKGRQGIPAPPDLRRETWARDLGPRLGRDWFPSSLGLQ